MSKLFKVVVIFYSFIYNLNARFLTSLNKFIFKFFKGVQLCFVLTNYFPYCRKYYSKLLYNILDCISGKARHSKLILCGSIHPSKNCIVLLKSEGSKGINCYFLSKMFLKNLMHWNPT